MFLFFHDSLAWDSKLQAPETDWTHQQRSKTNQCREPMNLDLGSNLHPLSNRVKKVILSSFHSFLFRLLPPLFSLSFIIIYFSDRSRDSYERREQHFLEGSGLGSPDRSNTQELFRIPLVNPASSFPLLGGFAQNNCRVNVLAFASWNKVSLCSSGWPGTHCVAQASIKQYR